MFFNKVKCIYRSERTTILYLFKVKHKHVMVRVKNRSSRKRILASKVFYLIIEVLPS